MNRRILHIDANCFFASVECFHRPQLRKKPMAVAGDPDMRHGIILTANYLAKSFGVRTGEPIWQAREKCPSLVIVPANMPLYMRYSQMLQKIFLDYTDLVQPFGCDEAWMDVTHSGCFGTGEEIARTIMHRVEQELGITVSVGVSFNKIFAKLGSDMKKPNGLTEITPENFKELIWPLPVSALLYVGNATRKRLELRGITTIGELAHAPDPMLKSLLGKNGLMLKSFANGRDCDEVEPFNRHRSVQSIGNSTTAYRDLENEEDVKMIFLVLADSVARRAREQGLRGRVVTIQLRDNGLYRFSRQHQLTNATDLASEIFQAAFELFHSEYAWDRPLRSAGITLSGLRAAETPIQLSLFEDDKRREKREKIEKTTDELKRRFGASCVRPAALMKDPVLTGFCPKTNHVIHPVGFFY